MLRGTEKNSTLARHAATRVRKLIGIIAVKSTVLCKVLLRQPNRGESGNIYIKVPLLDDGRIRAA